MRSRYVDIVKEYVKLKPEYKSTLDKIKEDVNLVGATDEEFDEAIRQLENTSELNPTLKTKIIKFANKKSASVIATSFVFLLILLGVLIVKPVGSTKENNKIATRIAANANSDILPVVYANNSPIDSNAVFSIPSDNIKLTVTANPKKEIMGFFPYWMIDNQDKINLTALTSVSLFALQTNFNGEIVTTKENNEPEPGWAMWKNENLDKFISRAKSKGIKVYLTIKCFASGDIESIAKSDKAQQNLIANSSYFVESKNLDGINIDFEYVGNITADTRDGFSRFIRNLNTELKRQNSKLSLTIDTYLSSGAKKDLFDLPDLVNNSDAFVIMGYDVHTPNGDAGPVSPMGGDSNIIGFLQNYLEQVPADKLILAVPYYGYDWPLDKNTANSKAIPYAQIAQDSKNINLSWNENSQTPFYEYFDKDVKRIVHFDNVRSLGIKYDLINQKNLKGVGIWALGYEGLNSDLAKLLIDKFIY